MVYQVASSNGSGFRVTEENLLKETQLTGGCVIPCNSELSLVAADSVGVYDCDMANAQRTPRPRLPLNVSYLRDEEIVSVLSDAYYDVVEMEKRLIEAEAELADLRKHLPGFAVG